VGSNEPTGTLDGSWGTAMTWKDELLMLWIFCAVVITFAARHFFGGAVYLVEQLAAFSIAYMPGLLHVLIGHLR
jgi:ACR3 family arsenite efflux pump ArsB